MITQLEQQLRAINEKTLVDLVTSTVPDMTTWSEAGDRNPFLGRIRKRSRIICYVGSRYADKVNEQREAEGRTADFVPCKRTFGVRIPGTPLLEHKGERYLQYLYFVDQVSQVTYEVDGLAVPESLIEPWLKQPRKITRQGLDDEVAARVVKLVNVVSVDAIIKHADMAQLSAEQRLGLMAFSRSLTRVLRSWR